MAPNPLKGRVHVLQHTLYSAVYVEIGDDHTVLKAGAVWVDGKPYGWRPFARNTSDDLRREARIYEALGSHERITKLICLEVHQDTAEAWALRLERAPLGCLRIRCGVLWGDLSTRNALVFEGLRLKLCDFAGSRLKGVYDDVAYEYEIRYRPPLPSKDCPAVGSVEQELFALGTAIYEITEWKVPYGTKMDDIAVDKALGNGEWPVLSADNPARDVILRCWGFKCDSAQEALEDLKALSIR